MESPSTIETLIETTEAYAKTSFQLAKIQIQGIVTTILSRLIIRMVLVCVLLFFILLFNIGFALWLGEIIGKNYFGFFILAGFYLVLGLVVHLFLKDQIRNSVTNFIVNLHR
ncbi:MAG: phage holin family protein [Saprospiraceae bacterium]